MKRLIVIVLCVCMLACVAACAGNPSTTDTTPSTQLTEPPVTEPPITEPPVTEPPVTEPPETEPPVTEPPETEPPANNSYTNLLAHFADGVDTSDKYTAWGWDEENKYIEASKSLECNWGYGGYGKVFLVDGVKTEKDELLFTQGIWVSCLVLPGWSEFEGDLDKNTVTWRKSDLDEWLIFDLQTVCVVDKVNFSTIYQNSSRGMPADFTIQVSSDKVNWKTVVDMTGYEQDITSEDQTFTFGAEECRYVRINFTKASKKIDDNLAYCAGLSEVEIWGKVK